MRIALFSASGDLSSTGLRVISAVLKKAGHTVKCVFLARDFPVQYEWREIERVQGVLNDSELVMVSVYSAYLPTAKMITEFTRRHYPDMKIIWGGPHCVSSAQLSLPHADGVCFAEGEQAVVELANKMEAGEDYLGIPNMGFNVDGRYVVNRVRPQVVDLDSIPFPDYDMSEHFVLDQELLPMTKELFRKYCSTFPFGVPTYHILTMRGCPSQCSYCNNVRYVQMYGRNRLRFRSVDSIIEELENQLAYFGFIKRVGFVDDDFLARPLGDIEDFSVKYKTRIGFPFSISLSANSYRKEKFELLVDAGLKYVQVGMQSGSQRVLDEVYNRNIRASKTKKVVEQIVPYRKSHDVLLFTDFIIDNPYETEDDIIQTYYCMLEILLKKSQVHIYALSFFPGTPIFEKACADGIIDSSNDRIYRLFENIGIWYQNNYEMFLVILIFLLSKRGLLHSIPQELLRALGSRPLRRIASKIPDKIYRKIIHATRSIVKYDAAYDDYFPRSSRE